MSNEKCWGVGAQMKCLAYTQDSFPRQLFFHFFKSPIFLIIWGNDSNLGLVSFLHHALKYPLAIHLLFNYVKINYIWMVTSLDLCLTSCINKIMKIVNWSNFFPVSVVYSLYWIRHFASCNLNLWFKTSDIENLQIPIFI